MIHAMSEFLEIFFENLLLGMQHELKNLYLHVAYKSEAPVQSANAEISKCKNGTLDCTLEALVVLRTIAANPSITQKVLLQQSDNRSTRSKHTRSRCRKKATSAVPTESVADIGKCWSIFHNRESDQENGYEKMRLTFASAEANLIFFCN